MMGVYKEMVLQGVYTARVVAAVMSEWYEQAYQKFRSRMEFSVKFINSL